MAGIVAPEACNIAELSKQLIAEKERRMKLNQQLFELRTAIADQVSALEAKLAEKLERIAALELTVQAQKEEADVNATLLDARESALQEAVKKASDLQFGWDCALGDVEELTAQLREAASELDTLRAAGVSVKEELSARCDELTCTRIELQLQQGLRCDAEQAAQAAIQRAEELAEGQDMEKQQRVQATALAQECETRMKQMMDTVSSALAGQAYAEQQCQIMQAAVKAHAHVQAQLTAVQQTLMQRLEEATEREHQAVTVVSGLRQEVDSLRSQVEAAQVQARCAEVSLRSAEAVLPATAWSDSDWSNGGSRTNALSHLSSGSTRPGAPYDVHASEPADSQRHVQHTRAAMVTGGQDEQLSALHKVATRNAGSESGRHPSSRLCNEDNGPFDRRDGQVYRAADGGSWEGSLEQQLARAITELQTTKIELQTTKAFGRTLLSANRGLQAQCSQLRRELEAGVAVAARTGAMPTGSSATLHAVATG